MNLLVENTNDILMEVNDKKNSTIKDLNSKINDLTVPLIHLKKFAKFELGELEAKYSKEISKLVKEMGKIRDKLDMASEKALFQENLMLSEELTLAVALMEDETVRNMFSVLMETEDKTKPSLQPPKEWIEKMTKSI